MSMEFEGSMKDQDLTVCKHKDTGLFSIRSCEETDYFWTGPEDNKWVKEKPRDGEEPESKIWETEIKIEAEKYKDELLGVYRKTLGANDFDGVEKLVPDVKKFGDADYWRLVCKVWSEKEGWMKSTKVLQIVGVGCLVQVTTQQYSHVAEAVTFVPGVELVQDDNGHLRLSGFKMGR